MDISPAEPNWLLRAEESSDDFRLRPIHLESDWLMWDKSAISLSDSEICKPKILHYGTIGGIFFCWNPTGKLMFHVEHYAAGNLNHRHVPHGTIAPLCGIAHYLSFAYIQDSALLPEPNSPWDES